MPKLKTKSAVKKRFKLTGTGKVRANGGYRQHNTGKLRSKTVRHRRGTHILSECDANIVRGYLPYG